MKNLVQKRQLNLYHKEQLVILLLLFCFALSGFLLPERKDESSPIVSEIPTDQGSAPQEVDSETPEVDTKTTDVSEDSTDNLSSETSTQDIPTTAKPSNNNSGSSSNNSSSSSNGQPVQKFPEEPEKIWVPPVYETIHHEAVYQTVRVVVCNYCGASFSAIGEFQVHKDANGG